MYFKIIAVAATVFFVPASAFAYGDIDADREIHGIYATNVSESLADNGIEAARVEAWGDAIRVDAVDAEGRSYVVVVSKDTLTPLNGTVVR